MQLLRICFWFSSFFLFLNSLGAQKTVDSNQVVLTSFIVFFETDATAIDTLYSSDLQRLATQIINDSDSARIQGFTDNVGNATYNRLLSKKRALAVRDFLVEQGVPNELLRLESYGEEKPQADNRTSAGRAQNRRVEIALFSNPFVEKADTNLVDPTDADLLQLNIDPPGGAKLVERPMPRSSRLTPGMMLQSKEDSVLSSNGSTALLQFRYTSGEAPPKGIFFQVEGAESFYDLPMTITEREGDLEIPIGLPTNVDKGGFHVIASLYNRKMQISPPDTTNILLLRLGTGKLQISLSWNNKTDQDLYVTDPTGKVIYYNSPSSSTGGELDKDDTNGFGPENIFWLEDAPDGTYHIQVDDYSDTGDLTAFVVTFNGMGTSRRFTGTTQYGSRAEVITFEKKGNQIMWRDE